MSIAISRRATLLGFHVAGVLSFLGVASAQAASASSSPDATAEKEKIVRDLVTANHILFREGIVDAFGHVTARDPTNPAHYLMARSVSPPFVGSADIVELDADSKPVAKEAPDVPFERFIHGEIYRVRPDVQAIVHSHASAVLPFGVVKSTPLRAICHTCGFLGSGAPIFEIRDVAGESSNMLVQNIPTGQALAKSLGGSAVVLMRGHGFTVVGANVREAVYNAINTVLDARIEMDALRLGDVNFFTPGEAAAVSKLHNASLDRSWEIWAKRAAGELP
jgi:ribulose-5-phosphate 4-epimerase/fuculose-1-phosphate aldolase